jgi:hypothetical protein
VIDPRIAQRAIKCSFESDAATNDLQGGCGAYPLPHGEYGEPPKGLDKFWCESYSTGVAHDLRYTYVTDGIGASRRSRGQVAGQKRSRRDSKAMSAPTADAMDYFVFGEVYY